MHWIALRSRGALASVLHVTEALAPVDLAQAMAWQALQFSAQVARVDDAVVVEASASERLFGGRAALLGRVLEACAHGGGLAYAQGPTSLVALGRLWAELPQAAPDDLPLQALQAARSHVPTLLQLGCGTWGQLRALPRAGLARRFGSGLVDALDCAYGARPEVYPWVTLPAVFDARLELPSAVESAPALLFGARRLLDQLQWWLQARQLGVLALELAWQLDVRRSNAAHVDAHHNGSSEGTLVWRTAQATRDMAHVQRLLAELLAGVRLPAPVLALHLRSVQTQALSGVSGSLLVQDVRAGDAQHQMLERLAARLGPERVLWVQPRADHVPERMQQWGPSQGAHSASGGRASHALGKPWIHSDALYPTWLLAQPEPLVVLSGCPQYHGSLTLLAGPQRLETGWLEGQPVLRDYFMARSPHAGLVWVFRQRLQKDRADWYLHGLFS